MIVSDPDEFLAAFTSGRYRPTAPPTARAAFLVSPIEFSLASESATDNRYMDFAGALDPTRALVQHAELTRRLGAHLPTLCFPGDPACPDGVFPNNVFATTRGCLIVGRMRHAVRRREALRRDIRDFFVELLGYSTVDLSTSDDAAELTGALVIDRSRNIGYCGLSERCTPAGARAMHAAFGLDLMFCFELAPGEYHTNVVLAMLAGKVALIAADGFASAAAALAIEHAYGEASVILDTAQKNDYAGNAIALGEDRAWFSARAAAALRSDQCAQLGRCGLAIEAVDLAEIEKAGGSLRCCVAEIF
ncbi:MAG: arginine deiminase-related protein [Dokdonella sp.]